MMRTFSILLVSFLLLGVSALPAPAQSPDAPPVSTLAATATTPDSGSAKARAVLDAMVKALGGDRWLGIRNTYTYGRIAAFYQGKPTGATVYYWSWHTPEADRIDLSEKAHDTHNWTQVFAGKGCWEFTFRGRNPIPKDACDEAIRRHDHSIENAIRVWLKDPNTILMYEGQSLSERHLAEQVTLLNAENDSITIQVDAQTHLPLGRSYSWRDPVYKDKNEELEEYDDYHVVDGLPTPFTITRFHNGDMTQQRFVFKASYDVAVPPDAFDPNQPARMDVK
ncbi:MAG TPA: hypothetical protein VHX37_18275 [Acidobacteriaceae bacterium]|jgi:hypothetical protein|nr:hypothetical protein [Acidobacteriaceae bacterium]